MVLMTYMAYNYALYNDKNRDIDKIVDNYEKGSETASAASSGPSWDNAEDRPWIILFLLSLFIVEVIILYTAILIALRSSQSNLQLIVNLLFALFVSGPYVFFNVVFNSPAYVSLKDNGSKLY